MSDRFSTTWEKQWPLKVLEERESEGIDDGRELWSPCRCQSYLYNTMCVTTSTILRIRKLSPKKFLSLGHTQLQVEWGAFHLRYVSINPVVHFNSPTWLVFQKKGYMDQWSLTWLYPKGG